MRVLWCAGILALALVLLPIAAIFLSWMSVDQSLWRHLFDTQLAGWLKNTFFLTLLVGLQATIMGVFFAWLFVFFEFFGRRWLEWLIVLPLTIPAYIYAFIFLEIWGYTGPVQTFFRSMGSDFFQFADIRNLWTLSWVLSICLYPYTYLLAREAFLGRSRHTEDAAKMLGAGTFVLNVKLRLGLVKGPVIVGAMLVIMETLADFGAVSMFNIDTLTVGVYKAWFEFFDINTACQLASLLLVGVFVFLLISIKKKRDAFYQADSHMVREKLKGRVSGCVFFSVSIFLMLFFVLPLGQLIIWVIATRLAGGDNFTQIIINSFKLAICSSILIVICSLLLASLERLSKTSVTGKILSVVRLGYATPGTVLAVGLVMVFGALEQVLHPVKKILGWENSPLLLGGVSILLVAYLVRFLGVGVNPLVSSMAQISTSIVESARLFERSRLIVFTKVHLPFLKKGLLTAGILVFVDVVKEMPATLLLRPFGLDTLAVKVFELTSEGEYERAALPALMIILLCAIPVILTITQTDRPLKK